MLSVGLKILPFAAVLALGLSAEAITGPQGSVRVVTPAGDLLQADRCLLVQQDGSIQFEGFEIPKRELSPYTSGRNNLARECDDQRRRHCPQSEQHRVESNHIWIADYHPQH